MDKRLLKRQKRQVARKKLHVKLSEPDVRSHEEIQAAREASQANASHEAGSNLHAGGPVRSKNTGTGSAAKTDV